MARRVREHPDKIKLRQQLAEHPFGTLKRWWSQGYFLCRGLKKVKVEMSLSVLAYNLRRATLAPTALAQCGVNILGVPKLWEALRARGAGPRHISLSMPGLRAAATSRAVAFLHSLASC